MTTASNTQPAPFLSDLNDEAKTIAFADKMSAMMEGGAKRSPRAEEGCRNLAARLYSFGSREAAEAGDRLVEAATR